MPINNLRIDKIFIALDAYKKYVGYIMLYFFFNYLNNKFTHNYKINTFIAPF